MSAGLQHVKGPIYSFPTTHSEDQLLKNLPGLRLTGDRAQGREDAIVAAYRRLGRSDPKFQGNNASTWPLALSSDLRDYQAQGVKALSRLLKSQGGALLADDLGLGKTRQTLELLRHVVSAGGDSVVVTVASVRETWRDELTKWWPECPFYVMDPKHREPPPTTKVLVASTHDLATGWDCPIQAPTMLVLEEAHELRGRKTKRMSALQSLAMLSTFRLGITATPNYNLPRDLWSQLNLILPGVFGSGFEFDLAYCAAKQNDRGNWVAKGASRTDELKQRLSHYMIRRTKADVATELPSLTRQIIWVDETKAASEAFKRAVMTGSTKLWHIAKEATLHAKYELTVDLAVKAGKSLIFTWRHEDVDRLHGMLVEAGVPTYPLTGGMTAERRQATVKRAASEGASIVATLDSSYKGINMQAVANVGIMHALDDVPLKMAQGEGRLHRLGQTQPVIWYYPAVRESHDVVMIERIVQKMDHYRNIIGRDNSTAMRDDLQGQVYGGSDEQSLLKSIYEEMKEEYE